MNSDFTKVENDKDGQLPHGFPYLLPETTWNEILDQFEYETRPLLTRLIDLGYSKPSQIQCKTIPFSLSRKSVGILAQSHNGSGKTLAFLIPAILKINLSKPLSTTTKTSFSPQVIILAHTNKLCGQIIRIAESIADRDIKLSNGKEPAHILIKTPGGLLQLLIKKQVDLSHTNLFIIDEVDGQLQGESNSQINQLISLLPQKTSLFCFSATYNQKVVDDINRFFTDLHIETILRTLVPTQELKLDGLIQLSRRCQNKIEYVCQLIKALETDMQVIIFVNTKNNAQILHQEVDKLGLSATLLISLADERHVDRVEKLNNFREGKFKILITTNLLAKRFDQRTIGLVINFDLPRDYTTSMRQDKRGVDLATYLHRIGQTGRYDDTGLAINLYTTDDEKSMIEEIQNYYSVKIQDLSHEKKEFDFINDYLDKFERLGKEKRECLQEKI